MQSGQASNIAQQSEPQSFASNVPMGTIFGYQQDADKLLQVVNYIESKITEYREAAKQIFLLLDLQENVKWPELLDKYSSLASGIAQLQTALKKSTLSSGIEDYGCLLRTHLVVPHRLSNDLDNNLSQATDQRLRLWNHDIAPEYLRTKFPPEIETDELQMDSEKNARTHDQVNKQIIALNKHIESLLTSVSENARNQADVNSDPPTYDAQDTQKLVRAIMNGEGMRAVRAATDTQGSNPSSGASASATSNRSQSSALSQQSRR